MQAFILAAGCGTRLKPLTDNCPKALVEVQGHSMLEITIKRLTALGIRHIVINIHHFANQIADFIAHRNWNAEIVLSDEREELLDTGGGLKKAAPLLLPHEPVLVHNVDILSRIDLLAMEAQLVDSTNLALLAVSQRDTSRQLLFDSRRQLVGWHDQKRQETRWVHGPLENPICMAFSGIAMLRTELLSLLPESPAAYPIIPAYLDVAKTHGISCFQHPAQQWLDIGKPETLKQAQRWKLS